MFVPHTGLDYVGITVVNETRKIPCGVYILVKRHVVISKQINHQTKQIEGKDGVLLDKLVGKAPLTK